MIFDATERDLVGKLWMAQNFAADKIFARVCNAHATVGYVHNAGRKAGREAIREVARNGL